VCKGMVRNSYENLVDTPESNRPFGRHMYRCDDIININLEETGWEGAD
jgi:hypothetical protein